MKKKLSLILLDMCLMLGLVACGKDDMDSDTTEATTETVVEEIVDAIPRTT